MLDLKKKWRQCPTWFLWSILGHSHASEFCGVQVGGIVPTQSCGNAKVASLLSHVIMDQAETTHFLGLCAASNLFLFGRNSLASLCCQISLFLNRVTRCEKHLVKPLVFCLQAKVFLDRSWHCSNRLLLEHSIKNALATSWVANFGWEAINPTGSGMIPTGFDNVRVQLPWRQSSFSSFSVSCSCHSPSCLLSWMENITWQENTTWILTRTLMQTAIATKAWKVTWCHRIMHTCC